VTVDAALVKARHGNAKARRHACVRVCAACCAERAAPSRVRTQAMLVKWSVQLAQAGLRGKHVSFEAAGESQARAASGLSYRAHGHDCTPHACCLLFAVTAHACTLPPA
jgi:hypothetical protein